MNTIIHERFGIDEFHRFMQSRNIISMRKGWVLFLMGKGFVFDNAQAAIRGLADPCLSGDVYECRHDIDRSHEIRQIVSNDCIKLDSIIDVHTECLKLGLSASLISFHDDGISVEHIDRDRIYERV